MANGVIVPTNSSGWIEVNANLYYKVLGGIVFVKATLGASQSSWGVIGTLPSVYCPEVYVMNALDSRSSSNRIIGIATNGQVEYINQANSALSAIVSYPIKTS